MRTLKDVVDFRLMVWQACELHGSEAEFQDEFSKRFRELGETIRVEKRYTVEAAKRILNLQPKTPLGFKAEDKFQELKDWVYGLKPFSTQ